MSETDIVNEIRERLYADFPDARLFRNNNGRLRDITGGYVTYGLGPGTSDLVGFRRVLIEPHHVGYRLAQFVALEVKKPDARPHGAREIERWRLQQDFLTFVASSGGCAGFARSYEQACNILNQS